MRITIEDWIKKVKFEGKTACVELCEQDPELAVRVFNITDHVSLGKTFVEMYKDKEQYHHSAYFISVELGKPIKRNNESERVAKQIGYFDKSEGESEQFWKELKTIIAEKKKSKN